MQDEARNEALNVEESHEKYSAVSAYNRDYFALQGGFDEPNE